MEIFILLYKPKLSYCDLALKIATHFLYIYFCTWHSGVTILDLVTKGLMIQKILKLTLIEMFNHGCDIDTALQCTALQYFHWTLFLLIMIYHQIEFGCKRLISLELIKDIVETIIYYTSSCSDLVCEDRIPLFFFFFFFGWHSGSWWCTTIPSLVKKGCLKTLTGNKYVSRVLLPSPLKIPQCFPLCRQIIHHTRFKKKSKVAAARQLIWIRTLG